MKMMKLAALLKRFENKFPLTYFFITGLGGGSLFVFLMRQACPLFIAPEFSNAFDHVTVLLAMFWMIWRVFKYAFR